MSDDFWTQMWNDAETWRLMMAVICGIAVGVIYFYSLRWSINHLSETKHRFGLFGLVALFRIVLFFTVLVLIGHRNIAVIMLYLLAFFLTKIVIVGIEKGNLITEKQGEAKQNEHKN